MSESILERRPLYGIGTVARLTGLKPDTLRVWERRYGLGAGLKSSSGRRQYSQGDLEHLQLVAALVNSGTRIGEIAGAGRKTLEALLRNTTQDAGAIPVPKPVVAFVGSPLCNWLGQHQGCLAGVDALLLRAPAELIQERFVEALTDCDAVVLFAAGLSQACLAQAGQLKLSLGLQHVILVHEYASSRARQQAQQAGYVTMEFPPESARLAFELSRIAADKLTEQGARDLGQLATTRPREINELELAAAATMEGTLECECPGHLVQLVSSLAKFESYSAECATESWSEAALHARVYAFTAQARWLIERALKAVLEDHEEEFSSALARIKAKQASDKAA